MQDILAARQGETSTAAEEAPSLVQAIWRQRWVLLALMVVGALLGVGLSTLQAEQWTAQSRIFLATSRDFDPLGGQQFGGDAGRFVADQLAVLDSTPVLTTTIKSVGLDLEPWQLRQTLKLEASQDSNLLIIQATAGDPETAKETADALGEAYRAFIRNQVDEREKAALASAPTADRAAIRVAADVYGDGVKAVEPADVPISPSSPQPVRNALILALVGALVAAGYALYTQSWSRRKVGPGEGSAIFSAPVLSEIPDRGRISGEDEIAAAYSEPGDAYRMAAVGLDYIRGTAPGVFLITAPHDGAGSSLTALNLAAAAADHGRRAFLLNIEDTVRPQADADGSALRVPLHELAQGRIDLNQAVERRAASRAQFGIIRLQVVQPVQGHPVADVQQILDQLPDDTDLVLLDAPPLPTSSASFVLAGQVDAAVVVMDENTTPADLEELQRRCRLAGIPVAGIVVNHIRRAPRNAVGTRRKRKGPEPQQQGLPRLVETSPRGLPILTGGTPLGDGRLHLPDSTGLSQYPGGSPFPAEQASYPQVPDGAEGAYDYGYDERYQDATADGYPQQAFPQEYAQGYGDGQRDGAPEQDPFPVALGAQQVNGAGVPVGSGRGPQGYPAPGAEAPWSSVTRVVPGWDQVGPGGPEAQGDDEADGRRR